MKLKIKQINKEAIMPKFMHNSDAGMDVCSCEDYELQIGERHIFDIGFAMQVPIGYEIQVRARSGLACKNGITVANGIGTIDAGYTNSIGVCLINLSDKVFKISKGDRIAQLVINKIEQPEIELVEELDKTDRGEGGFGSTGI